VAQRGPADYPARVPNASRPTRESADAQRAEGERRRAPALASPGALLLGALRRLPVHALSRVAGRAASLRLPAPLRAPACRVFARAVGADLAEVRDPLDSFASLQDFFTRALRPDARAIDRDPAALVAPCDGRWGEAGRIADGALLQLKGSAYSLAALLGDAAVAKAFEGGWFATFYLAPRDYHRFHAPCDGFVARAVHLPGSLWPVNRIGLEGVPGLFAANERICAFVRLRADDAGESLALVAVGATLVGKVRVAFDPALSSNTRDRAPHWRRYDPPPLLSKGSEWGHFEFGSTLVLAASPDALVLAPQPPGSPLRLGTRIGTLTPD
jgi:phosphatidylserine decarboxylase